MINYIIYSTICLAVCYTLYEILFSRIKSFRFNRVLLLFCVAFSFIAPLIHIELGISSANNFYKVTSLINTTGLKEPSYTNNSILNLVPTESFNGLISWFLVIELYVAVVLVLLFRFDKNLRNILVYSQCGERSSYLGYELVLHDEKVCPYSFLRTIFVNKKDLQENKLNKELIEHEMAHIKQLHSVDIIFIELVSALMWFNPMVYVYKRAIKVNHEYLADSYVLESGSTITGYSSILLNFASGGKYSPLISGINYSFIKKRITMLLKTSGNNHRGFRFTVASIVLTGLFVFTAFDFTSTERIPDPVYNFSGTSSGYRMNDTIMYHYGEFTVTSETKKTIIKAHRLKISNGLSKTKNYFENDFLSGKVYTDGVDICTNKMFLDKIISYHADQVDGSENSDIIKLKGNAEVKGEDVTIKSDEITLYLGKWR